MKRPFRLSLATLALTGFIPSAFADPSDADKNDMQALREWMNLKRQVTVKELGGSLAISGQVRAEFQATSEKKNGAEVRRVGGKFPARGYDVEVNLMFDYRADRSWASIKLEFDNNAGVFSGGGEKLNLERALVGARLIKHDAFSLDAEIGRNALFSIFDSQLQFSSNFDGVLLKYDGAHTKMGDFYVHAGAFVVDERRDHYGLVGETGLLNIGGSGFYVKYSLIDWALKNYPTSQETFKEPEPAPPFVKTQTFQFLISQGILGYRFTPSMLKKVVVIYGSGLVNHKAEGVLQTGGKKSNWGAYGGVSVGQLRKKWDWSADVNYQWLSAQAVPSFDVFGIKLGNAAKEGFYTENLDGTGPTVKTQATAVGNGNYRGLSVKFDILLSDMLALTQSYMNSTRLDNKIGPAHTYSQYEVELVYTF